MGLRVVQVDQPLAHRAVNPLKFECQKSLLKIVLILFGYNLFALSSNLLKDLALVVAVLIDQFVGFLKPDSLDRL